MDALGYYDCPAAMFCNTYGGFPLTSVGLRMDFHDYIVAQTVDPRAVTGLVYTARASGEWWFIGDGTVGPAPNYTWRGVSAADYVSHGWNPVTDGSEPPHVHDGVAQTFYSAYQLTMHVRT